MPNSRRLRHYSTAVLLIVDSHSPRECDVQESLSCVPAARTYCRSDFRGHLQAHAGVDLIPREIVGLADGLHLRPRILPDCGVLQCYPPDRISWRNGVADGLRLSPCRTTRVHGHSEGCGNDQSPEPATTIFRAVPSHGANIRDDHSVPNGIFLPSPRSSLPVESSPCVSRTCNYVGANGVAQHVRLEPDDRAAHCRGTRPARVPLPSSWRGGFGIRGSSISHCSSVRSTLCFSPCKCILQSHYVLTSAFMRWPLMIRSHQSFYLCVVADPSPAPSFSSFVKRLSIPSSSGLRDDALRYSLRVSLRPPRPSFTRASW